MKSCHKLVGEILESFLVGWLGENISHLFFGGDPLEVHLVGLDLVAQPVKANVHMAELGRGDLALDRVDHSAVVLPDSGGHFTRDSGITEKASIIEHFSHTFHCCTELRLACRQSGVLSLAARPGDGHARPEDDPAIRPTDIVVGVDKRFELVGTGTSLHDDASGRSALDIAQDAGDLGSPLPLSLRIVGRSNLAKGSHCLGQVRAAATLEVEKRARRHS